MTDKSIRGLSTRDQATERNQSEGAASSWVQARGMRASGHDSTIIIASITRGVAAGAVNTALIGTRGRFPISFSWLLTVFPGLIGTTTTYDLGE